MKTRLLLLWFLIFLFACQYDTSRLSPPDSRPIGDPVVPPPPPFDLDKHLANYEDLKIQVRQERKNLQPKTLTHAQDYLFDILTDSIFPYWNQTTWDFNGITETPRKGDIACGYFVTTTLRDVGISVQRYKLAQQAATNIVKKLCEPTSFKRFNALEKLQNHLQKQEGNHIFVIGLDYHVGFVVKENNNLFFVHSNYINRAGVIKEPLHTSQAIDASNAYVIGNLLTNKSLIQKWLGS